MRVEIDISAANDLDAHRWLDRILHKIEDGWHVWDTANEANPEAMEETPWIRERRDSGASMREFHVASVRRDAWTLPPHGRRVRVTTNPGAADDLSPENAARLAEEPLWILVENRKSDGAFVKRVVAELDKSLHRLWSRPGEPIRFDSVGGTGQMPEVVRSRTPGAEYRPRLVAIIDSDRKGPNETESAAARKLRGTCEHRGVPCWVLAKREAENYLPRILLGGRQRAGAEHARLVDAWDRLNDDQKNFFDMKNGLPEDLSAIEQVLFDGLPPADRKVLSRGFGQNVYACWTLWDVPHGHVKAELLARGQDDLERGVNLIRGEV